MTEKALNKAIQGLLLAQSLGVRKKQKSCVEHGRPQFSDAQTCPCAPWEALISVIRDLVAELISQEEDQSEEKPLQLTKELKQLWSEEKPLQFTKELKQSCSHLLRAGLRRTGLRRFQKPWHR